MLFQPQHVSSHLSVCESVCVCECHSVCVQVPQCVCVRARMYVCATGSVPPSCIRKQKQKNNEPKQTVCITLKAKWRTQNAVLLIQSPNQQSTVKNISEQLPPWITSTQQRHFGESKLNHCVEKLQFSIESECNQARFRCWHHQCQHCHYFPLLHCTKSTFTMSYQVLIGWSAVLQCSSALATCSASFFQRSSIF